MTVHVTFTKCRSKSYDEVCAITRKLGGTVAEDGSGQLDVSGIDLMENGPLVMRLCQLCATWRSMTFYVDGKVARGAALWILLMRFLECYYGWQSSTNTKAYCRGIPSWCRSDPIRSRTFGCRMLSDLVGHQFREENWWDCGELDSGGRFHVDKKRLLEVLEIEARKKMLFNCPQFSIERIRKIVAEELPDVIDPRVEAGWTYVTVNGRRTGIAPKPRTDDNPFMLRLVKGERVRMLQEAKAREENEDDDLQ